MARPLLLLAALLLGCAAALCAAQEPYTDVYWVPFSTKPVQTPWRNGTQVYNVNGVVPGFEVSAARAVLGPCTYRQLHYHSTAEETLFLFRGKIVSVLMAPNGTAIFHSLDPRNAVVYPRGWAHYQYNPTCEPAESFISFNAAVVTTFNMINYITATPAAYTNTAFARPLPAGRGTWAAEQSCLRKCGIPE